MTEHSHLIKYYILPSFMHWLLILNASTNFLIYCFMGKQFKTVLISLLRDFVKMKGQVNIRYNNLFLYPFF